MTPDQEGLLTKAHRSLRSATNLVGDGDYDFAASRAYYAMFYAAEAMLLLKGLSFSSHSAVHAAFGLHFSKAGLVEAKLHRYLLDGQDTRATGDYDIHTVVTEAEAREQIAHAEEFLQAAERFLSGSS